MLRYTYITCPANRFKLTETSFAKIQQLVSGQFFGKRLINEHNIQTALTYKSDQNVFLGTLNPKDGTDHMSRNVDNETIYATKQPRRVTILILRLIMYPKLKLIRKFCELCLCARYSILLNMHLPYPSLNNAYTMVRIRALSSIVIHY